MNKYLLILFLSAIATYAIADSYVVPANEKNKILEEAEDWIDDMPIGLQERLSDAVEHSKRGFFSELNYFRSIADTAGNSTYNVLIKNYNIDEGRDFFIRSYSSRNINQDKSIPLLIFFHGGGWSMGSVNTTDKFCRDLAYQGNVNVVSINYPLSPENSLSYTLSKCKEIVTNIISHPQMLGFNPSSINLGGEGAGGNIVLNLYDIFPNDIRINSLVLYYPLLLTQDTKVGSKLPYSKGFGLDSRLWESFLEISKKEYDNFTGEFPSTLLIMPGRDIMIDAIKSFSNSHKMITYVEFEGAIHGFISDGHQLTALKQAVEITDEFLTRN